jgi:multisubunit Na+/H+ antiporter MnhF subunit
MIDFVLNISFGALTLAILLGLFRLAKGPSVIDRILAFDLIATCAVGMVVLLSLKWQTTVYLELILIFSLLGFFGAVAFVFYLHRSYEVEAAEETDRPEIPERPEGKP